MRLSDYVTAIVLGFLVALCIWICLCTPLAVLFIAGTINTYPIFGWPMWVSSSIGASVAGMIILLERGFDKA